MVLTLLLIGIAAVGCRPDSEAQDIALVPETPLPCVRVIPVSTATVTEDVILRANLVAHRQATVMPGAGGWLRELHVDQGDPVIGEETVMATITSEALSLGVSMARTGIEIAQAGLRQAELQLRSARTELERIESLHRRGVATDQQLEQVQLAVEAAEEMVTQARANVRINRDQSRQARDMASDTEVVAPFDGVVYQRMVEVGQLIAAYATPMFVVIDPSQIQVIAGVPEYLEASVRPGTPAQVVLSDGRAIDTTISYVAPGLDMVSRNRTVWAQVENPEGSLVHGGTATLRIELGRVEAVVVPRQAIARVEGSRGVVFVLKPDGSSVAEVTVLLGTLQNDAYPVLEGLEPGTEIVEYGWTYLEEGSLVRVTRGQSCEQAEE
ncbi:MAG: efflux RND transporter periplasmic adaptor subunit [Bradymonadales bacterium]|nr:efflux RND transporter periplasmic adaptor subunit [Bradymonadales bacterium]